MKKTTITSSAAATHKQTSSKLGNSSNKVTEQQTTHDPALSRSFRGHEDIITGVDFDPKMRQVASCSKDSIVYVWNFKPQQRPFKFVGHKGAVYCVKYSPDGETIASCGQDRQIRLWQNTVQSKCSIIKAHCGSIRSMSFSADGGYLLSSSDDKTLKLWRLQDKKFMCSFAGHKNWVRSGVISPDMRLVASASDDKSVMLWDLNFQKIVSKYSTQDDNVKISQINTYSDHMDTVSQVLFHPDGTCLISSSFDHKIKITDIRSNKLIQHYNAHDAQVNSISIHPTGYFLASAGSDSKIKIWDLRQGRQIYTLYSNDKEITTVSFNQSGDYFATGGSQNLCMVWKTNFDQNIQNIEQVQRSTVRQNDVEYSSGGLYAQTLFKTNKTASLSPARKNISIIPPQQLQDTFNNRGDDELNIGRVHENKQSNSPTFSQQQQQLHLSENQYPGLEIVGNQFNLQQSTLSNNNNQNNLIKSQNDSIASNKNAIPFHPSSEFQQSNVQQQFSQQPKVVVNNGTATYPSNFIPKVEEENIMTEAIAASMQQIYSRLDTMFQYMTNLENRVVQSEQLQKSFVSQNHQNTLDPKQQTMNFGYSNIQDQSLSASLNDRNVVNIFQTGALANTGSIEASLITKQQEE
ncbi:hypothetical protein ABPG74_013022 [Tetrahymena malaccensis]